MTVAARPQDAFKNGAGPASSPRFVRSTAFYGNEPSPPLLLADFPERTFAKPDATAVFCFFHRRVG